MGETDGKHIDEINEAQVVFNRVLSIISSPLCGIYGNAVPISAFRPKGLRGLFFRPARNTRGPKLKITEVITIKIPLGIWSAKTET